MRLFGFQITRSPNRNAKIENRKSFDPVAWLAGSDSGSSSAAPLLSDPFSQVTWVYRAASVLAEQIANIPFLFSRGERGRENLITSGPLLDFYGQPHPYINRFQYWELRVLWLLLRGECFRIPIYSDNPTPNLNHNPNPSCSPHTLSPIKIQNSKKIKNVLILNPDNFHEIIENHQLLGWRYTGLPRSTPLESQVFLPEEVWHDKLPNPFNFWRGLSPLLSADLAIRTDYAAAAFARGYIENNADNGLIIRTTDHLDDIQKEQLIAALNNRKRRAGSADRPLLLWNSCEIVKPTLSSADFQFLENRKFSRSEICSALGVPEEIVATTDHNKYDVMQGARLNFIENRVAPLCARLEAEENATTIPALSGIPAGSLSASPIENQNSRFENAPVACCLPSSPIEIRKSRIKNSVIGWFDLDSLPIMQQARRNRIATAKIGFDMGVPFNELNRVLDLGFQPLPHGDTCYLPSQLQAVGHLQEPLSKSLSGSPVSSPPSSPMSNEAPPIENHLPAVGPAKEGKSKIENLRELHQILNP